MHIALQTPDVIKIDKSQLEKLYHLFVNKPQKNSKNIKQCGQTKKRTTNRKNLNICSTTSKFQKDEILSDSRQKKKMLLIK